MKRIGEEMKDEITLNLGQISSRQGDKEHNIKSMKSRISQAKKMRADLVAFPELALTGYVIRDRIYELAESIPDGPSVRRIEEIARKEDIHVIFGMIERSLKTQAVLHNTAVLVGPKGYIGKYRKMYLPTHSVFEEKGTSALGTRRLFSKQKSAL